VGEGSLASDDERDSLVDSGRGIARSDGDPKLGERRSAKHERDKGEYGEAFMPSLHRLRRWRSTDS
jgi:hypothetical protein